MNDNFNKEKLVVMNYLCKKLNINDLINKINIKEENSKSQIIVQIQKLFKSKLNDLYLDEILTNLLKLEEKNIFSTQFFKTLIKFISYADYYKDDSILSDFFSQLFISDTGITISIQDVKKNKVLDIKYLREIHDYLLTEDYSPIPIEENLFYENNFIKMISYLQLIDVILNQSLKLVEADFSPKFNKNTYQYNAFRRIKYCSIFTNNPFISKFILMLSLSSSFYPFKVNFWVLNSVNEVNSWFIYQNVMSYLLFSESAHLSNLIYNVDINEIKTTATMSDVIFNSNFSSLKNFQENFFRNILLLKTIYYDIRLTINTNEICSDLNDIYSNFRYIKLYYNIDHFDIFQLDNFLLSFLPFIEITSICSMKFLSKRDKINKKTFNFTSPDLKFTIRSYIEETKVYLEVKSFLIKQNNSNFDAIANNILLFWKILINLFKLNFQFSIFSIRFSHNLNFKEEKFKEIADQFINTFTGKNIEVYNNNEVIAMSPPL